MNEDTSPHVDVVIPVHDVSRPLQRAIDSLLRSGLSVPDELRITVICHNLPQAEVESMLDVATRAQVRFLELADSQSSPAGPFMLGLRSATAEFVSIMGSDDWLEPGALRGWWELAHSRRLTALIPPERHSSGAKVATPPIRPTHRGVLDPIRDRLAYRTAPLGLIRRSAIDTLGLDMPSRLKNGSDQLFGIKLWYSGQPIRYGRGLPHYVVGADAKSRVTFTERRAEDELRAVTELVADPWVRALPARQRRAIVAKSVRVHLFSAALVRTDADRWKDADRAFISETLAAFALAAPGYERVMSIADRRLIDALLAGDVPVQRLGRLLAARRRYGRPVTVLTRDIRGLLATDGPLRFMIAARLL